MRIGLYLFDSGISAIAKGEKLYGFHFGVWSPDDGYTKPDARSLSIPVDAVDNSGFCHIPLPTRDVCLTVTVANLRQQQQDLQAETEKKCTQIEQHIQSLLALEGPVTLSSGG